LLRRCGGNLLNQIGGFLDVGHDGIEHASRATSIASSAAWLAIPSVILELSLVWVIDAVTCCIDALV